MEYQPRPYEAYEEQPIPHQQQHQQQQPPMQQHSLLSNGDFLKRVEIIKADILTLTSNVSKIASLHQSVLGDPYSSKTADLNALITQTQVLNTSIKDQIKFLETDAARSHGNAVKDTQVKQLKNSFQRQLQDYRAEEANYERQYREQIKRQYEIVNPHASEAEKEEAAEANWGDEGVFQTALRSNRSATATTVLGAVRARHNDIQKIETTIIELNRVSLVSSLPFRIITNISPRPAHGRTRHDHHPARRARASHRAAHRQRAHRHGAGQHAADAGHQVGAPCAQTQVVVPGHHRADLHHHRARHWAVFRLAEFGAQVRGWFAEGGPWTM